MNLREVIVVTASYYSKPVTSALVEIYASDLADLNEADVVMAYHTYRRDPKNRTFPLPAQIREIVQPSLTVSDDSLAREAAARITEAISRFGYMRGQEAKLFIGEVGWGVVKAFGGWQYVCENHGQELNTLVFMAQAREMARSHIEMARSGILGQAPSLPSPTQASLGSTRNPDGLTGSSEILKKLTIAKP